MVNSVEECKRASKELNAPYKLSIQSTDFPAGCFFSKGDGRTFFNVIVDPFKTSPVGMTSGVCSRHDQRTSDKISSNMTGENSNRIEYLDCFDID